MVVTRLLWLYRALALTFTLGVGAVVFYTVLEGLYVAVWPVASTALPSPLQASNQAKATQSDGS